MPYNMCLLNLGTLLQQVDAIVFYDKPFLKLERLLESYLSYAPRGIRSFIAAMPVWLKEKMFLKRMIRQSLTEMGFEGVKKIPLLFPSIIFRMPRVRFIHRPSKRLP